MKTSTQTVLYIHFNILLASSFCQIVECSNCAHSLLAAIEFLK